MVYKCTYFVSLFTLSISTLIGKYLIFGDVDYWQNQSDQIFIVGIYRNSQLNLFKKYVNWYSIDTGIREVWRDWNMQYIKYYLLQAQLIRLKSIYYVNRYFQKKHTVSVIVSVCLRLNTKCYTCSFSWFIWFGNLVWLLLVYYCTSY